MNKGLVISLSFLLGRPAERSPLGCTSTDFPPAASGALWVVVAVVLSIATKSWATNFLRLVWPLLRARTNAESSGRGSSLSDL